MEQSRLSWQKTLLTCIVILLLAAGAVTLEDGLKLVERRSFFMDEACRQAKEWRGTFVNGTPPGMSVNVSASMFRAENAAQRLKKIVRDSGIAPQDLSLVVVSVNWSERDLDTGGSANMNYSVAVQM